jgi:ribose 5-phosphate isomerase B
MKEIVIGCDNAAVELKNIIIKLLEELGVKYEDVGVVSTLEDIMYPLIAERVCKKIMESNYEKEGILVCGTGIGMAIAANKFPGIYAAVCHDAFSAERARLSNDTNIMTMGARVIGPELAKKLVREWLSLEFKPGSSTPKVEAIKNFEKDNFKGISVV